jgi:hypothetical protein
MERSCIYICFPGNHKDSPFILVHLLDGKSGSVLHFAELENPEKGGAQLMIINTIQFCGKAFVTQSGGVDFDSRSAPVHR